MLTNEQKLAKYDSMEANFNTIAEANTTLETSLRDLQGKYAVAQQEISDKATEINDVKAQLRQIERTAENYKAQLEQILTQAVDNEVESFMIQNSSKIKPAEREDLKAELVALKNSDIKISNKSLYDRKKDEIINRTALSGNFFNVESTPAGEDDLVMNLLKGGK